ncbi:MAG: A/G-specific adenine glycosylase [Parasporobacterium sp.]|nr:A/G-specific adenine glycosylase [Parasporobacterium sp.]
MLHEFDLKQLVIPLRDWYLQHARILPWRQDPSPYHVWISEIMLQQTRVEAVKRYYERFLSALPDVADLARCGEDTYLKLWEGLGYYSRVRNLHEAAIQIMDTYQGRIPDEYEELLKLKGIGHYTAGAIASIAYGKPVPAVDGNVFRILTRVSGDDTDITKQSFRTLVEERLRELMQEVCPDVVAPAIWNQALMELGALVCVPNGEPHCDVCPWKEMCLARREGRIAQLPCRKKPKERRIEERTVLLIRDGSQVALHKRPAKGLLAGLYEFPNKEGHLTESQVISLVRGMGYSPLRIRRLSDSRHIFSHVEWQMIAYHILVEEEAFAMPEQKERAAAEQLIFTDAAAQKAHYALPSAFSAYKEDI